MVKKEQILETERKCEEIRKRNRHIIAEGKHNFKTLEEIIQFYDAVPFEDFDKRFRSCK